MGLGREAHHIADRSDDLRGQYFGPTPKISVRVVPEASTSASMRPSRSAIFRCSVRMSRKISEASCRRRRAEAPWDRMPRRMCMRLGGSRAFQLPHRGRGLVEARAGCLERSGTLGHQVFFAPLGKQAQSTSEAASGSTVASRSLREAANAVARASSLSFLRALPAKLESTRTRAESLGATRPPPTRRSLPASLPGAYPEAASVLDGLTTLGEPCRPASSRALKPARFCGKLARSMSSPVASSTTATATLTPCGDRPR